MDRGDLFLKLFGNKVIRNNILRFIHIEGYAGYYGSTSLSSLLSNEKYSMILDKLRSNHLLIIDYYSFNLLEANYSLKYKLCDTVMIEEIYQLIWKNYKHVISNTDIKVWVQHILEFTHSNYIDYNITNFSNNNSTMGDKKTLTISNIINPSYKLFDLLEISLHQLEYSPKISISIIKTIEQIKYNNNKNKKNIDKNQEFVNKKQKVNEIDIQINENIQDKIKELIYSNNSNNIPITVPFSFKLFDYHEKDIPFDASNHENAKLYFNYLFNTKELDDSVWFEIFKVTISIYNHQLLAWLLENYSIFKEKYIYYISNYFKRMFKYHFKKDGSPKQFNFNKIYLLGQHLKEIPLEKEEDVQEAIEKKISKKKLNNIYLLDFNLLLNNLSNKGFTEYNENEITFEIFIRNMLLQLQQIKLDPLLEIVEKMDQSILDRIYNQSENPFKFLSNKSNILIYIFLKSAVSKDYKSIIKILNLINNNYINGINEQSLSTIKDPMEIITYLSDNNLLKPFSNKCLIELIIEELPNFINQEFILNLVDPDNDQVSNYKEYFKDLNDKLYETPFHTYKFLKTDNIALDFLGRGLYESVLRLIESRTTQISRKTFEAFKWDICKQIPMRWFEKLYEPMLKHTIIGTYTIIDMCSTRFDITEFYWSNCFTERDKRLFLETLLQKFSFQEYHPLIQYILKEKKQYIISLNHSEEYKYNILNLAFTTKNTLLFKLTHSAFPSTTFKINKEMLLELIKYRESFTNLADLEMLEFFFEYNLIPNLRGILGEDINNLIIIDYFRSLKNKTLEKCSIIVSKSTFILIHTIIKHQENK
ncbi:hypothetical protein DICPUDRAFT_148710 [Dictyostelium purpureum]|uniref:Uncharacterized protein n=1 Tax=Dictyostelium purpureum TaxID=5786 RepID=F0ZBT3_DICPU|nr:uncharacterized protein DICPUDRAFT_148710 [Dictyostelium purpureum]EGC38592.1 hypothetical protein DICPUDRAFT_148710 [Dictyostelium purpureum]|eukprot:XP_003284871.1 hypothetical protein DICPUDRAFT_148710 [Dictyostelium purpureum]